MRRAPLLIFARAAARAALVLTTFCAALSAQAQSRAADALTPEQNWTGTWVEGDPQGAAARGGTLLMMRKGSTVQFQLSLQRGAPSFNSGFIEGSFAVDGATGSFHTDAFGECSMNFALSNRQVTITDATNQAFVNCGFGYGVYVYRPFHLKSHKPPQFGRDP